MNFICIQRVGYHKYGEDWKTDDCFLAADSIREINFWAKADEWQILPRSLEQLDPTKVHKDIVYVGTIEFMQKAAEYLGFKMPSPINIPKCLESYCGRKITYGTIKDVTTYPVFIKPAKELKLFSGGVITKDPTLILPEIKEDTELLISEPIDIVSEYRCFVFRGELISMKHYGGNFKFFPDVALIEQCISDYEDAPVAYCIDFAITSDGKTRLVEVNDFWSCGTYGFTGEKYIHMLTNRWREIIKEAKI